MNKGFQRCHHGVALVIVLAFIVLLTGAVVAFFSWALSARQGSNNSANQTKVELFSQGAVESIIGDLRQEIAAGSTAYTVTSGTTIYRPRFPMAAMPMLVGSSGTGGLENLIKRSVYGTAFFSTAGYDTSTYPPSNRAAQLSSTLPSQNGRYISPARWNQHLLLARQNPNSASDTTPVLAFVPPDWILVARDGSNPGSASSSVVGRYAYAIYNEGGLLDINAAGYPSVAATTAPSNASAISNQTVYKSAVSYADLTQLGLTQKQVDQIVGWRNNATALATGSVAGGYAFASPAATADNYLAFAMRNPNRFMTTSNNAVVNGATDRLFVSRQQLINFFFNGIAQSATEKAALANVLKYLGTFSRSLNQPSYWPDPARPLVASGPAMVNGGTVSYSGGNSAYLCDDTYNPAFRKIRVSGTWLRCDGSTATPGEPLVKKRFALERLAWLTYKGPSAALLSAFPSDPVLLQYLANGISKQTLEAGTADHIKDYFGLTWTAGSGTDGQGGYWTYDHGVTSGGAPIIGTLDLVAANQREPDFFELLKAGICAGSLSKAWTGNGISSGFTGGCRQKADTRIDFQILQIGANLIDAFDPDDFPTQIVYGDGSLNYSFWGKENLPYLSGIAYTAIARAAAVPAPPSRDPQSGISTTDGGEQVAIDVPIIWAPYAANSAVSASLSPANLRVALTSAARDGSSVAGSFTMKLVYSGSGAPFVYYNCPWKNVGSYDAATGSIKIPATSASNTVLYFSNNNSLYRDPTPLWRPGIPAGSNLHIDSQNLIVQSGSAAWNGGIPELGSANTYVGFFVAKYPECVTASGTTYTVSVSHAGVNNDYALTCSLEYESNGNWIPYMQYSTLSRGYKDFTLPYSGDGHTALWYWPQVNRTQSVEWDPRTARWGQPTDVNLAANTFLDSDNTVIASLRPSGAAVAVSHGVGASAGWFNSNGTSGALFYIGNVCQNLYGSAAPYFYYSDPDGTVRRGMAGAVSSFSAASSLGLPLATVYNTPANLQNRPVILNRLFRSVAEMGGVFRDTPWKNLDFYIPESGDSALLDIFCIAQDNRADALAAGKVDLNTRQSAVIQAILAGAYRDELGSASALSGTEATALAQALVARTTSTGSNKGPLANVADLVGRYTVGYSNANGQPYAGFSEDFNNALYNGGSSSVNNILQRFRETAMRALSDTGMAGTWNLLIDVVAQTGRYPAFATSMADFVVEGERHYWVHLAIDRQTALVIDEQIEPVDN